MQLRPQIQIQTIIKAMMEDVIPALDQTNQLAMQSAQLTIGTLTMIAQHLPLEYRYDCDELARLIDAAAKLREQAQGGTQTEQAVLALRAALEGGREVLDRARAEPAEIVEAVGQLRRATGDTVRAVYAESEPSVRDAVDATVLEVSKEQLLRDRSWLLMQGWEPDPGAVPAVETLLRPVGAG